MITDEVTCSHEYQYMGLKYQDTGDKLPGSGATNIAYFDAFFCSKCLDTKKRRVDRTTNSYQKPLEGSTPC